MIQLTPLAESDHPHFAKELFESAFPEEERPPFGEIKKRNKEQFHFQVATLEEDDEPIGILTYWTFEDFIYVEHFAIDEEMRNRGLGRLVFLTFLSQQNQQVVFEVEMPTTELAARRIDFYKRMGLIRNTQEYWQPSYNKKEHKLAMQLIIMSKYELDDDEFLEIQQVLYKNVYHYEL